MIYNFFLLGLYNTYIYFTVLIHHEMYWVCNGCDIRDIIVLGENIYIHLLERTQAICETELYLLNSIQTERYTTNVGI